MNRTCKNCKHWMEIDTKNGRDGICLIIQETYVHQPAKYARWSSRSSMTDMGNFITDKNFGCNLFYRRVKQWKNKTVEKYMSIWRLHNTLTITPFESFLDRTSDFLSQMYKLKTSDEIKEDVRLSNTREERKNEEYIEKKSTE